MKKELSIITAGGLAILIVLILLTGCGRKGPPVPPKMQPVTQVTELRKTIESGFVRLTWNKPAGKGSSSLKGYKVYRSQTAVGNTDNCDGCPIMFEKAADLYEGTETYREHIEPGHHYIYKVIAISDYGTTSPDSELVKFTYSKTDVSEPASTQGQMQKNN